MVSQTQSTLGPSLTLPGSVFAGQLFLTPNTPSYRIPPPLSPPRIPPHRDTNGSSGSQSDSDTDAIAPSLSSASDDLDDVSEADTETSEDAPYSSGSDFEEAEDLPVLTHPPYRTALGVRFLSRSSLLADIQSFAKANGFGVTITRSSNKRVGYQYMQLKCVHGGRPGTHRKDYEKQRRRTIWARQKDCPFFIYARNHGGTDVFGTPNEEDWRIDIETQCDDRH